MFYIFSGDDRKKISAEVKRVLGEEYEIFEGEKLGAQDLMNICQGVSIFGDHRKILIRDLTAVGKEEDSEAASGVDYYAELLKYVDTPHTVVIWETRLSRKKSFTEFKKAQGVKAVKFETGNLDWRKSFEVVDLAMVDGKRAVLKLREIEEESDPYMFLGALAKKLCDNYRFSGRDRERLVALAELDMKMKTSKIAPWRLIEAFILSL